MWMDWMNQVSIFGFNSRKFDLNLVKEHFVKMLSNMSNFNALKKDNTYVSLVTLWFKFLDVRNYLAPGLSYDGWCKANGCTMKSLSFHMNGWTSTTG